MKAHIVRIVAVVGLVAGAAGAVYFVAERTDEDDAVRVGTTITPPARPGARRAPKFPSPVVLRIPDTPHPMGDPCMKNASKMVRLFRRRSHRLRPRRSSIQRRILRRTPMRGVQLRPSMIFHLSMPLVCQGLMPRRGRITPARVMDIESCCRPAGMPPRLRPYRLSTRRVSDLLGTGQDGTALHQQFLYAGRFV
jgi:hypothetical protein